MVAAAESGTDREQRLHLSFPVDRELPWDYAQSETRPEFPHKSDRSSTVLPSRRDPAGNVRELAPGSAFGSSRPSVPDKVFSPSSTSLPFVVPPPGGFRDHGEFLPGSALHCLLGGLASRYQEVYGDSGGASYRSGRAASQRLSCSIVGSSAGVRTGLCPADWVRPGVRPGNMVSDRSSRCLGDS